MADRMRYYLGLYVLLVLIICSLTEVTRPSTMLYSIDPAGITHALGYDNSNNRNENSINLRTTGQNNDHWNSSFRGIHSTIKARLFDQPTVAETAEQERLMSRHDNTDDFTNYRRLNDIKSNGREQEQQQNRMKINLRQQQRRLHDADDGGGGSYDSGFIKLDTDEKGNGEGPHDYDRYKERVKAQRLRDAADYVKAVRSGNSKAHDYYFNPYAQPPIGSGGYIGGNGPVPERFSLSGSGGCPFTGSRNGWSQPHSQGCGCGCPTTAPLLPSPAPIPSLPLLPPPQPLPPLFPPPSSCACPLPRICPPPTTCPPPPVCPPPLPPPPCPKPFLPLPCPAPLLPAPCICPPAQPLLPSPIFPPAPQPRCLTSQPYIPQNDCCCNCQRPCRNIRLRRYSLHGTKTKNFDDKRERYAINPKCNSNQLQRIIIENISDDLQLAKRRIQTTAESQMSRAFNTICGAAEFSFIVHAKVYCQASVGNTTCYAFSYA